MIDPEELMRLAIEKARQGIAAGQSPFGCVIARGDEIVAVEHNLVWRTTDPTAHAEVNALRSAGKKLGRVHLADCVAATTCEPCPMCLAALHWSRVPAVYFGASIADAASAGFNELAISAADLVRLGGSPLRLEPSLLVSECRQLFQEWLARPIHPSY